MKPDGRVTTYRRGIKEEEEEDGEEARDSCQVLSSLSSISEGAPTGGEEASNSNPEVVYLQYRDLHGSGVAPEEDALALNPGGEGIDLLLFIVFNQKSRRRRASCKLHRIYRVNF